MLSYEPVLSHYYARFWNTSLLHMLYLVIHGPNNIVLMHGCTLMKWWLEENFLKPKSSKIVGMINGGLSTRNIAGQFRVNQSIIIRRLLQRYRTDGTESEHQCSGRPRKTDEREHRYLRRLARANPTMTARRLRDQWQCMDQYQFKRLRGH